MRRLAPLALSLSLVGAAARVSAQDAWSTVPDEEVEAASAHYPEANERGHEVYFDAIRGLGGGYLGVGSDPSYTLAAVARSEWLTLVDYDPVVSRLHRAMAVLLAECADAACLRAALEPQAELDSTERIARRLGRSWEASQVVYEFRVHRPLLRARMAELAARPSFLSVPEHYAHVHGLAERGRIVARTADLRGPTTIRAMARAARREGVTYRVVYLSNAEEYFAYDEGFRQNLEALPADAQTVVLRTLRARRLPHPPSDSAWHYDIQPLADLIARIRDRGYRDVSWLQRDLMATRLDATGLSRIDASVPALATAGPRRWWLDPPSAARRPAREGRSSVLETAVRALGSGLDGPARQRLRGVDLDDTGLAHLDAVALPRDLRTGRAFALSGLPSAESAARVDDAEHAVLAMLLDAMAREVLPEMLTSAGRADAARTLRLAPAANDLYGAFRLRDRLLEICPDDARARGEEGRALRACRSLARLAAPPPNARTQPEFADERARVGAELSTFAHEAARLAPDAFSARSIDALERVAAIARELHARAAADPS